MSNERILLFEAPWSANIADTRATTEIYTSLETLLSIHPDPARIIQRPLLAKSYLADICNFTQLECNKRGQNIVVFSAHGSHDFIKTKAGRQLHRRRLGGFDGEINLSKEIRKIAQQLPRTIFLLDACETGKDIKSFRSAAGCLGAIGFSKSVSWIDSSAFILALLMNFQEKNIFNKRRARRSTGVTKPAAEKILDNMQNGPYKSLMCHLGVEYSFG